MVGYVYKMKILHYELGNERVNAIWEKNIPAGWEKPSKVCKSGHHDYDLFSYRNNDCAAILARGQVEVDFGKIQMVRICGRSAFSHRTGNSKCMFTLSY